VLEKALEALYMSAIISEFKESKRIHEYLISKSDMYAHAHAQLGTPENMQQLVLVKLRTLPVPLVEALCREAFNHSLNAVKKEYSDTTPASALQASLS
jgi:hypothetical protein